MDVQVNLQGSITVSDIIDGQFVKHIYIDCTREEAIKQFKIDYSCQDEDQDQEPFEVHGVFCISNAGGYEVQLSPCGDAARLREAWGGDDPKVTPWLPIEWTDVANDPDLDYLIDEDYPEDTFFPVIDPDIYKIPLDEVMRTDY